MRRGVLLTVTVSSACWIADAVPPWYHVHVYHLQDMDTDAVPPFDLFAWTGFAFLAGGETVAWITNHHLDIRFRTIVPPTPPPPPTIELPLFHRDYRYQFSIVHEAYGPVDIDPCP